MTIPADIREKARKIGENWFGVGHHDSYALAAEVEALLVEQRERCAQIAERMLVFADTTSRSDKAIASAIRNEGEQKT